MYFSWGGSLRYNSKNISVDIDVLNEKFINLKKEILEL